MKHRAQLSCSTSVSLCSEALRFRRQQAQGVEAENTMRPSLSCHAVFPRGRARRGTLEIRLILVAVRDL